MFFVICVSVSWKILALDLVNLECLSEELFGDNHLVTPAWLVLFLRRGGSPRGSTTDFVTRLDQQLQHLVLRRGDGDDCSPVEKKIPILTDGDNSQRIDQGATKFTNIAMCASG